MERNEHQSEPPPALYVRHIGKIGLLFLRSIIAVSGGGAATFAAHSMAEMDPAKREILKDQLRLIAADRGNGIDLDSAERWAVEGLRDRIAFFRHLNLLIPTDSILYFEASDVLPEAARFYEIHR